MKRKNVKVLKDNLNKLEKQLEKLTNFQVLVGVPANNIDRKEEEKGQYNNNAILAYIHDNGSPAANIPARPFMRPGIKVVSEKISVIFKQGISSALKGDLEAVNRSLNKAGLLAQLSIRKIINDGIAPPLADSTLRARMYNRKNRVGAKSEIQSRKLGNKPSIEYVKPLIDTGQLRNSINYVIRKKAK